MSADTPRVDWVFLRGLARENAHWDDFPQRFAKALPEARIHLLDLPGNGEHWRVASPMRLDATLDFIREQTALAVGRDAKLCVFAMSLGAMVTVAWAQRYPAEIAGAVLVNTSLGGFCPFYRRLSWRVWPLMLRIALCTDLARRERLILALTARQREASDAFIAGRAQTQRHHPVRGSNVLRQLYAASRFRPLARPPEVPLLLLNSLGDRMVDPRCSEALAGRWGVELKTHPAAGHDLPLDDPGWTVTQVRNWWDLSLAARRE